MSKDSAAHKRIVALQDAIRHAFPAIPHAGKITCHDGAWLPELTDENAIHDDDMFVYEALSGRVWPEIEKEFLHTQADGYVLLTNEALRAYLGAWLVCSLDNIDSENNVREFLVYAFSPDHEVPEMTWSKMERLRALNPEQRLVLRSLLSEFAQRERSSFVRKLAIDAVELIDSLHSSSRT